MDLGKAASPLPQHGPRINSFLSRWILKPHLRLGSLVQATERAGLNTGGSSPHHALTPVLAAGERGIVGTLEPDLNPSPQLAGCVALSKSLNLLEPQYPHL